MGFRLDLSGLGVLLGLGIKFGAGYLEIRLQFWICHFVKKIESKIPIYIIHTNFYLYMYKVYTMVRAML